MQERRKTDRDRTLLGGRIAFNNRRFTVDCVVRNMSRDGAKIVFPRSAAVPNKFEFITHRGGQSREATIIWRDEKEAGVAFVRADPDAPVSGEITQRIRKLEAEREVLSRRVVELSQPA